MHIALLQNPVLTLAFLTADCQMFTPLASLTMMTKDFCEPLWRNKPFAVLTAIYTLLALVSVLVRYRWTNFAKLYDFAQLVRLQFFAVGLSMWLLYILLLCLTRKALERLHQGNINLA